MKYPRTTQESFLEFELEQVRELNAVYLFVKERFADGSYINRIHAGTGDYGDVQPLRMGQTELRIPLVWISAEALPSVVVALEELLKTLKGV